MIIEKYGFDKPVYVQYMDWLKSVLKFDFGMSIKSKQQVSDMLLQRIPITIRLSGMAFLISILISVPLGLVTALKKDSWFDRLLMWITSVFQAVPNFWLAMLFLLFFSVKLGWFPLNGYGTPAHYVLPVAAIVLNSIAVTTRMTKVEVLEIYREKFVLTAYAKGLKKKSVIIKHVLRNSLILVVVLSFMSIPWIISGSIIIENVFVIPGMGSLLTQSIIYEDFPVVQASVLLITMLVIVCNICSDLITALLDPRIRIEITGGESK